MLQGIDSIVKTPEKFMVESYILIPKTVDGYEVPMDWVQENILQPSAVNFGGFSLSEIQGGYVMKSTGELIQESLLKLVIAHPENSKKEVLQGIAEKVKKDLAQESVYFNYQGKVFFV